MTLKSDTDVWRLASAAYPCPREAIPRIRLAEATGISYVFVRTLEATPAETLSEIGRAHV